MIFWIILMLFIIYAIYALHISLPKDICDRSKLQFAEFWMRIGLMYIGDFMEMVAGAIARNKYNTRFLLSLGFIFPGKPPENVKVTNEKIAGVKVRVYQPKKRKSDGVMVFIHGGGWTTMRPKYYDSVMYDFIEQLGTVIVSIDYRLAPEYPFPIPVNDCHNVVKELYKTKYSDYGVDRNKIVIFGDSAGGNLSAVICQRLAREGNNFIKAQALVYPVTHCFGFLSPSYQDYYKKYNGSSLLSPTAMARFFLHYFCVPAGAENVKKLLENSHKPKILNDSKEVDHHLLPEEFLNDFTDKKAGPPTEKLIEIFSKIGTNPDASPIFGIRKDLPPALVQTCGYDVLRDEGIEYAQQLKSAGVSTEWKHYPRGFHGVMNLPYSEQSDELKGDIVKFFKKYL